MRGFLILGAFALFAWWIRGKVLGRGRQPETAKTSGEPHTPDSQNKGESVQRMVLCTRCGVHLPRRDAAELHSGRFICAHHAAEVDDADRS